ncbi:DUF4405 domain-containing protein [Poseidonibacter ostreae]|jgi:hypothetical protein|uniref:DUF4405 domain-containing protein n=1 Tax=Poseidonibacter ostreae TaxID=2654171 RepID=A0A6L4WVT5_9BACT|nr:DUF4405 domain-containing protein [Poseidonibacter ostreae]KAB7884686.1 DUF4405 domain-containing protein [Poseidonibacter ostreae]KAB7889965.1 DUF4405 domain-containing protein [Poseidonibacter ostreae]KAB7891479.1 DUF4405 domain-containing protein [Poseidonibacter ostreae]
MSLKKITSLSMLLSMLAMTYTGIILFLSPHGRIANWANWELLGLSKDQYAQLHSTFMVIFIIGGILHVYYNFKPMISYLKNKSKEFVFFTKDMLVASILFILFIVGTLFEITPFSNFLNFGDDFKSSWEKDYGTAPYSHAELSSLKSFAKKLSYDLEKVKEILNSNNIKFKEEQSLSSIGKVNALSPNFIYKLLQKNLQKEGDKSIPLTGLGKKTIKDIASTLNMTSEEFIVKLKTIGLDAKADDKFKEISEENDLSPIDVLKKLGFK